MAAYTPIFGIQVNVGLNEHSKFLLQPAAIDVPVARARAGRGQPAEIRPAKTPERVRLQRGVAFSAPPAPSTNSYFGGTDAALTLASDAKKKKVGESIVQGHTCASGALGECATGVSPVAEMATHSSTVFIVAGLG